MKWYQEELIPQIAMMLCLIMVAKGLTIILPEEVEKPDCKEWIWPIERDEQGRWSGFIRWENCDA